MLVLLALIGCQAPFGADRHDLRSNRVAAISLSPLAGDVVVPRLAIVSAGVPWTDALPSLEWSLVDEGDDEAALQVGGGEAGLGPAPELVLGDQRRVVLVVGWPDGERRHVIDVPEAAMPPTFEPIALEVVSDVFTTDLEGADLSPAIRRAWAVEPAASAGPDRVARLTAASDAPVRWMATSGDFLELESDVADWFSGSVTLDDGEVEAVSVGQPGVTTVVALAVGESTVWQARDLQVGAGAPSLTTRSGRMLPVDRAVTAGLVQGVLRAEDGAPSGLRFEVIGPVDSTIDPGTRALCAMPHAGPFDPDWLLDGTCLRAEVDGATVVVEAR